MVSTFMYSQLAAASSAARSSHKKLHGWDLLGDHHLIRAWGSIDLVVGVVDERLVSFPK